MVMVVVPTGGEWSAPKKRKEEEEKGEIGCRWGRLLLKVRPQDNMVSSQEQVCVFVCVRERERVRIISVSHNVSEGGSCKRV